MAMRLEDDDDRISGLAKLFFHELSKKGGARHFISFVGFVGVFVMTPFIFLQGIIQFIIYFLIFLGGYQTKIFKKRFFATLCSS